MNGLEKFKLLLKPQSTLIEAGVIKVTIVMLVSKLKAPVSI